MAWRQCLRLITVDETTVSSSRSSSSSRLLLFALLRSHLRRFGASLLFSSSFFRLTTSSLSLVASRSSRAMSLIFCSPFLTLLFFQNPPDLVLLRSSRSMYSFFSSTPSLRLFFLLLYPRRLLRFTRLPILLPRTPCLIVVLFFCYHTRAIREYEGRCTPGLDSTFRIVIEREHDR